MISKETQISSLASSPLFFFPSGFLWSLFCSLSLVGFSVLSAVSMFGFSAALLFSPPCLSSLVRFVPVLGRIGLCSAMHAVALPGSRSGLLLAFRRVVWLVLALGVLAFWGFFFRAARVCRCLVRTTGAPLSRGRSAPPPPLHVLVRFVHPHSPPSGPFRFLLSPVPQGQHSPG